MLPTEDEREREHDARVAHILAGPRWANHRIRREYLIHRKSVLLIESAWERDGQSLPFRARHLWRLRKHLEETCRARMNAVDRHALERRCRHVFGALHPTFEYLIDEAKSRGLDEDSRLRSVILWASRPDKYHIAEHPRASGCVTRDVRSKQQVTAHEETLTRFTSKSISWSSTGDPLRPWRDADQQYEITLNDFPEENLFSLSTAGTDLVSFDNWPNAWSRPEASMAKRRRTKNDQGLSINSRGSSIQ